MQSMLVTLRRFALLGLSGSLLLACFTIDPSDVKDIAATCVGGQVECDGACVDPNTSNKHCGGCGRACAQGGSCNEGRCDAYAAQACQPGKAPPSFSICGPACVDTDFSRSNCGECGRKCLDGQSCSFGKCTEDCNILQKYCEGRCIDPERDADNCGRCGNVCPNGTRCSFGVCE